jgi:glycogen debranching enzyme
MPRFLFLCALLASTIPAAELPKRFLLGTPVPIILKDVQPAKFLEAVGRRSALLGRENGTFEAWINPVKIVRDFRLSVYFDGSLEPAPLADFAERVEIAPGRVTIVHSHAAFTIRQTWFAPLDKPALVILLDIDTDRPLRIRASFLPEMKPMWPASFGGQSSYWDEKEHAFLFGEGLRRHTAVLGSPAFTKASEQVGHQLPDRTMLAEMEIAPEVARASFVPIVIAGSREIYRSALSDIEGEIAASDRYFRDFGSRTFRVETPVLELNRAFEWAKYALEKGWTCNDDVGCGLVAGYAESGSSERPGFAWYFGGDASMNSWSIVDYGDFPRARALLEFLRDHQRADGKMEHELTQSAALLDWNRYPYGYYHGDTTPHYLFATARYVVRSGDLDFLKQSWASLEKAYQFCLTAIDDDGLLSNRKAGAGAVETGALAGRVDKDVYLEGVWLAALDGYARLAEIAGRREEARGARERLQKARAALESWAAADTRWLPFARLTDGSMYNAQSSWQALALAYGGLDGRDAAVAALARSQLSTRWGTRLFATDSPFYDPLSYNDGSVWPFVTQFVIMAEFRYRHARAGLEHLYGTAAMTGLSGAGFIPEYISGERAQALPRAVPHQLFSSSAVVHPLISGLLGLEGDAVQHTLRFSPQVPLSWGRVRFEGYRVGDSVVRGEITHENGSTHIHLEVTGSPIEMTILPGGIFKASRAADVTVPDSASSEAPVELIKPEIGERARWRDSATGDLGQSR